MVNNREIGFFTPVAGTAKNLSINSLGTDPVIFRVSKKSWELPFIIVRTYANGMKCF